MGGPAEYGTRGSATADERLDRALHPEKVAVVGASATPGKLGRLVVEGLLAGGFDGEVVLVNPNAVGRELFGRPFVDVDGAAGADLAVLATPAATAPAVVGAFAGRDIGVVAVYASGFAEAGNAHAEATLMAAARAAGVRLLGPNAIGLFSAAASCNVTTLPGLRAGRVSCISQSGGLLVPIAARLADLGEGLHTAVSVGNAADIGVAEVLDATALQGCDRFLVYLERPTVDVDLVAAVERASSRGRVAVLLGGWDDAAQRAASSHTSALVGRRDRLAGVLEEAGAVVADGLQPAIAAALTERRPTRSGRVFVLADGGGNAVLVADALTAAGFAVEQPTSTEHELVRLVGDRRAATNPLELSGLAEADLGVLPRALAAAERTGNYEALVLSAFVGGYGPLSGSHLDEQEMVAVEQLVAQATSWRAPLVVQTPYARSGAASIAALRRGGVPCVEWPEEAPAVLGAPGCGARRRRARSDEPPAPIAGLAGLVARVADVFTRTSVPHVLGEAGAPGTDSPAAWAVKLDSLAHKARVGGIRLGVPTGALDEAVRDLVALADGLGIEPAVRVAPMVEVGEEMLVTLWREGPFVGMVVGAGGNDVERTADVAVGRRPASPAAARQLLLATAAGRRLAERSQVALDAVAETAWRVGVAFDEQLPELSELECNPVAVSRDAAVVLDVLPRAIER